MAGIFISYRRDDTVSATGRLADDLASRFGNGEVFRDIQTIDAGTDFRDALRRALDTAQIVLVVIGPFWSGVRQSTSSSRLDDPRDYVRTEIEEALARDIPIVPVLVEGARMPAAADLPQSIRALAYRQAHEISDSRWNYDTERLVELIGRHSSLIARPIATTSESTAVTFARIGLAAAVARQPADFLQLLYEPRRFLIARAAETRDGVIRACVFLVASQLLAAVLILQEWPSRSPFNFVTSTPLLVLLVALILSLPMYLSWRLAGAPRDYQRILVVFLYQCSFVGLCLAVVTVVMLVGLRMVEPQAIDDLAARPTLQDAMAFVASLEQARGNVPWLIASLISGFIGVGMVMWLAGSWSAYRLALGRSRLNSLTAFVLFTLLVAGPFVFLVWAALMLSPQS